MPVIRHIFLALIKLSDKILEYGTGDSDLSCDIPYGLSE